MRPQRFVHWTLTFAAAVLVAVLVFSLVAASRGAEQPAPVGLYASYGVARAAADALDADMEFAVLVTGEHCQYCPAAKKQIPAMAKRAIVVSVNQDRDAEVVKILGGPGPVPRVHLWIRKARKWAEVKTIVGTADIAKWAVQRAKQQ